MDLQLKRSKASPRQIPDEIIEEIISRVPVKTVLQCRCLSKPLCSLIGTKRFIAKHLRNSPPAASRFILNSGLRGSNRAHLFQQIMEFLLRNRVADRVPDEVRVLGCVGGLVCYLDDRRNVFKFWNPSTRVTTALPKVECNHFLAPGFGFDESTGEFKVFAVEVQGRRYNTKVYSSKSNSWKLLKASGEKPHITGSGIFVCGKLHWPVRRGGKHYVYSFDIKTEAFGEIELPQFESGPQMNMGAANRLQMNMGVKIRVHVNLGGVALSPEVNLGVLGGRLSSLKGFSKNSESKVEVWVMEEYGVKESWTKVVNLQPPYSLAAPFCTGPNGEILFVYGSYFLAYYPSDNVFRFFGHNSSYGGVYHCVESLVTPDYLLSD